MTLSDRSNSILSEMSSSARQICQRTIRLSTVPEMSTQTPTPSPRSVTEDDIIRWAEVRAQEARKNGLTPYLPRFMTRDPDETVRHVSLHVGVPIDIALAVQRLVALKMRNAGVDLADFHFLRKPHWHVPYGWINPGANAQQDQALIDAAPKDIPAILRLAAGIPRSVLRAM